MAIWTSEPFGETIDLSQLDGVSGLVVEGAVVERTDLGRAVAWAGDINQDGFDDLAIGASYLSAGGLELRGAAYLVFGSDSAPATIEAADLNGSNGFQMIGQTESEFFGWSVAGADVTGDGLSDLLVGATNGNGVERTGAVHVVFGSSEPFDAVVSYEDLDGTNGYRLLGDLPEGNFGNAMSAHDFNLDGVADILIGAEDADIGDYEDGAVYLVLGERRIKSLPVPLFNGLWMLLMIGLFAAVGWFGLRQSRVDKL